MFSAINIFCLAIGLSFCMLIGQYILHEASVNSIYKDVHQQYFLNSDWKIKNTGPDMTTVGPLSKSLKQNYTNLVSDFYRFNPVVNVVSAGDKHFREDVSIGDTNLVSMYGLPLLYGNPEHAFTNVHSAVITEGFALKLFGEKNVINKTITFTNLSGKTTDYQVSAVLKTLPYNTISNAYSNSTEGYAMYIPFEGNEYYPSIQFHVSGTGEDSWNQFFTVSFIKLQPGVRPEQLVSPIKRLLTLNSPETISKNLRVQLKPLDTYYVSSNNGVVAKTLSILSLVAVGILLLAVINFINIMIGTSSYRIREIGLRKIFGGRRKELILQYLVESIVLTTFAAILSLIFYGVFRPLFNEVLNTSLQPIGNFGMREILSVGSIVLIVGCLAGLYPAVILSGSEMVHSVKGKLGGMEKGMWMRKSLLVLQFTIAIGVFIFSMTISKQVTYFFNNDLGYDKDKLMVIVAFPKQWDSAGVAKMESIRNGLLNTSAVKDASVSFDIPEKAPPGQLIVNPQGSKNNQTVSIQTISVDEKYASTYGIHLLEGKFFSNETGAFVSGEAVINESAMKSFGWKSAAGKKFSIPNGGGDVNVVGVVKDFHLESMHESIEPLAFFQVKDNRAYRYITVKLGPGLLSNSIEQVKARWKEISPLAPFEFTFMDEKLQSMYQSELQLKKASGIATGLMLLIILFGIFGVLALALTRRTKEIAVRKVLGAEIHHILSLFIKQYAGLLVIANLIAWPLTYYFSNRWLQQYAYRIIQPVSIYFIAGIFVAIIAFILISLQCLKVALANPVKSLKTE
jgi:ABC-type antimicrobial peptide transport system permease subunit